MIVTKTAKKAIVNIAYKLTQSNNVQKRKFGNHYLPKAKALVVNKKEPKWLRLVLKK